MPKIVPISKAKHLISANLHAADVHERHGSAEITMAAVARLSGELSAPKILHVVHRLVALFHFLDQPEAKGWIMEVTGQDYLMLHEALFRAAARAPLEEAEYIKDYAFTKDTFLPIVLEEAKAEGTA